MARAAAAITRLRRVDFQNVAGLATNQGVQIIIEEGNFQGTDLVPELVDHPSHSEKAFHVLLNHPRVFRVASQFNYATTSPATGIPA